MGQQVPILRLAVAALRCTGCTRLLAPGWPPREHPRWYSFLRHALLPGLFRSACARLAGTSALAVVPVRPSRRHGGHDSHVTPCMWCGFGGHQTLLRELGGSSPAPPHGGCWVQHATARLGSASASCPHAHRSRNAALLMTPMRASGFRFAWKPEARIGLPDFMLRSMRPGRCRHLRAVGK